MLATVSIVSVQINVWGPHLLRGASAESKAFLVRPLLRLKPDELSSPAIWRKQHSELLVIDTNYHESLSTQVIINTNDQIACAHRTRK